MMKIKEIRDLIDFISQSELNEVNIETTDFKISVKKSPDISVKRHLMLKQMHPLRLPFQKLLR
jgi:acetyl-CoA carboxylase biotin carboxyl carrier protein